MLKALTFPRNYRHCHIPIPNFHSFWEYHSYLFWIGCTQKVVLAPLAQLYAPKCISWNRSIPNLKYQDVKSEAFWKFGNERSHSYSQFQSRKSTLQCFFFRNFSEEILKIQSIKLRLFIVLWQIFHTWIVILLNYWGYPWIYAICQGLFSIPSTYQRMLYISQHHFPFHIIDLVSHLCPIIWKVFQNVSLSTMLLLDTTFLYQYRS